MFALTFEHVPTEVVVAVKVTEPFNTSVLVGLYVTLFPVFEGLNVPEPPLQVTFEEIVLLAVTGTDKTSAQ